MQEAIEARVAVTSARAREDYFKEMGRQPSGGFMRQFADRSRFIWANDYASAARTAKACGQPFDAEIWLHSFEAKA